MGENQTPGPLDRLFGKSFSVTSFAWANIAFVLIAIGVAILLLREYHRMTAPVEERPPSVLPTPLPQEV